MGDVALHYTEHGAGEALILLHGNGESSGCFQNQISAFAEHFRVIAVDTRGHGASLRGAAPFTIAQFAEDLRDFLDERGIARAHILGFSDGANIALLFALGYKQRVNKLVLNGANLFPGGMRASVRIPVYVGYAAAALFFAFNKKALQKKELLGLMATQPQIRPEALSKLDMPVLVIAGDCDMIKENHTRLIARSIPHATLCLLSGDHFIAFKQAEAFNRETLAFLIK